MVCSTIPIPGMKTRSHPILKKTVENRQLQDLIQEVRVPTEMVTEVKDNKPARLSGRFIPAMFWSRWCSLTSLGMWCGISAAVLGCRSVFQADSSHRRRGGENGRGGASGGSFLRGGRFCPHCGRPAGWVRRHGGRNEHREKQRPGHGFHVRARNTGRA